MSTKNIQNRSISTREYSHQGSPPEIRRNTTPSVPVKAKWFKKWWQCHKHLWRPRHPPSSQQPNTPDCKTRAGHNTPDRERWTPMAAAFQLDHGKACCDLVGNLRNDTTADRLSEFVKKRCSTVQTFSVKNRGKRWSYQRLRSTLQGILASTRIRRTLGASRPISIHTFLPTAESAAAHWLPAICDRVTVGLSISFRGCFLPALSPGSDTEPAYMSTAYMSTAYMSTQSTAYMSTDNRDENDTGNEDDLTVTL